MKLCSSSFENSTYLWEPGDFIKPLSSQVVFSANAISEKNLSPFVDNGERSNCISIMPPIIRQENLHKDEVRGNFFLDEISCVRIDTTKLRGEKAGIDWRYSEGVFEKMYTCHLPEEVTTELIEAFTKMEIRFCAFDLVFTGKDFIN